MEISSRLKAALSVCYKKIFPASFRYKLSRTIKVVRLVSVYSSIICDRIPFNVDVFTSGNVIMSAVSMRQ